MARPIPAADQRFLRPSSTVDADQAVKRTDRFTRKVVSFQGTFAGGWDVDLEGSIDGENWSPIAAGITGPAVLEEGTTMALGVHWRFMRVVADSVGTQSDEALNIVLGGVSDP